MTTMIARMAEFHRDVLRELLEKRGETEFRPNPDFFADSDNVMLVAYTDGLVSGFLWAYVLASPDSLHPKMFLYSIDVFGDFRRRGIASQLIAELKSIARKNKCSEIFVPARKSNNAAVALYMKSGFKAEAEDDVILVCETTALMLEGMG